MRRALAVAAGTIALTVVAAGPALACGGLIGPNGAVNLTRTTTFAGYANGVEHYVTSFAYAGGGGQFGSLTPLPGVPTKVERGGDWTLQRLVRETRLEESFRAAAGAASAPSPTAQVLLQVKVDALDITVLKGGGDAVGEWAEKNGFRLPPDAPEVLDFYAARSPIFLAAVFDADAARRKGQSIGDGTPVHIEIPTENPWVPLRILALGKQAAEPVDADVYLLTEKRPRLLSTTPIGNDFQSPETLSVVYDGKASAELLKDLHDDRSGSWVPSSGWLTKVRVSGPASTVTGDLAIDSLGERPPSFVKAGLATPAEATWPEEGSPVRVLLLLSVGVAVLGGLVVAAVRR
ncbi:MAG TPA: DUF2330 domain-containing protein [Frankiaceae bacterium]|jgi:hypothetical protein|nr:DUF2330 domain-containing protein [Frankiaceae bacterium]